MTEMGGCIMSNCLVDNSIGPRGAPPFCLASPASFTAHLNAESAAQPTEEAREMGTQQTHHR